VYLPDPQADDSAPRVFIGHDDGFGRSATLEEARRFAKQILARVDGHEVCPRGPWATPAKAWRRSRATKAPRRVSRPGLIEFKENHREHHFAPDPGPRDHYRPGRPGDVLGC
jgi:hypothetical protein